MDLIELNGRMGVLEKDMQRVLEQQQQHAGNFIRIDEQMRGIREQAKDHNSTTVRITQEMDGKLDKLVSALGIDMDENAPRELREDFAFVRSSRHARESTVDWIRKSVVGAVVMGVLMLMLFGAVHYLKKELGIEIRGEYGEQGIKGLTPGSSTDLPEVSGKR